MYTGLYTAVAGGLAQEKRLNVLTNNLANATTAGFKAEHTVFHGLLQPMLVGPVAVTGADSPVAPAVEPLALQYPSNLPQLVVASIDPLAPRRPSSLPQVAVQTDFSQGPLQETGNALDLALEGRGFFVAQNAAGETFYTRQGTFSLNADGVLERHKGCPCKGSKGRLVFVAAVWKSTRPARCL
jgi:flagellar hook-basal body protein